MAMACFSVIVEHKQAGHGQLSSRVNGYHGVSACVGSWPLFFSPSG